MKHLRGQTVGMALVVALAVSVTSGVAATLEVAQPPAPAAPIQDEEALLVQAPVPAVATAAHPAEEARASAVDLVISSLAEPDAEAACSPPSQCFRDKDCDRICGKGNGVCVRINSCYRACYCAS